MLPFICCPSPWHAIKTWVVPGEGFLHGFPQYVTLVVSGTLKAFHVLCIFRADTQTTCLAMLQIAHDMWEVCGSPATSPTCRSQISCPVCRTLQSTLFTTSHRFSNCIRKWYFIKTKTFQHLLHLSYISHTMKLHVQYVRQSVIAAMFQSKTSDTDLRPTTLHTIFTLQRKNDSYGGQDNKRVIEHWAWVVARVNSEWQEDWVRVAIICPLDGT